MIVTPEPTLPPASRYCSPLVAVFDNAYDEYRRQGEGNIRQRADGRWIHVTEMNNTYLGGVGIFNDRDIKDVPGMSYILLP